MTMEILERVLKENNVPHDVRFMSDSGWECDPTEMDGVFYSRQNNTIVFTQGSCSDREYEQSEEWEILYAPELIKIGNLEIYPASDVKSYRLNDEFKRELKEAGEFEKYYGIPETEDKYDEIDVRRPLFYGIKSEGKYVGYIGFNGDDNVLEPEIYIFRQYRNKGYGTGVLKRLIDIAFNEGLLKKWREENTENPPPLFVFKKKIIHPSELVSTIRVENDYSRKMMLKCGFHENKEAAAEFLLFIDEKDRESEPAFVRVSEFKLSKDEYLEGQNKK